MERNPFTGVMEEHPASVQAQIALGQQHNRGMDRGVKPLPVVNQASMPVLPSMPASNQRETIVIPPDVQAILDKYHPGTT